MSWQNIHSYTHTLIHSYTHTYIHSYTHTYTHTLIHTLIHSYIHSYIDLKDKPIRHNVRTEKRKKEKRKMAVERQSRVILRNKGVCIKSKV